MPTWRELVDDPGRRQELETRIREIAARVSEKKLVFESDFDALTQGIADLTYVRARREPTWASEHIEQSVRQRLTRRANKLHIARTSRPIWILPPVEPLDPHDPAINARLERLRAFFNEPGQARELLRLYVVQRLTVDDIASQNTLEPAIVLMELWQSLRDLRELLMS